MRHLQRVYFLMVAGVFCVSSLAKGVGLVRGTLNGNAMDPLFAGIPQRVTLSVACGLELVVAGWLILAKDTLIKHALVAWLCFVFMGYRIVIALSGANDHCSCFGGIPQLLSVPGSWANAFAVCMLLFCFGVSSLCILKAWCSGAAGDMIAGRVAQTDGRGTCSGGRLERA